MKCGEALAAAAEEEAPEAAVTLPGMLRNVGGGDPRLHALALARIMEQIERMERRLDDVPTRAELRAEVGAAIEIHCKTCGTAREDGAGDALTLGRGGLSAAGRRGVRAAVWVLGVAVVLLVALGAVAPRLAALVAAWR